MPPDYPPPDYHCDHCDKLTHQWDTQIFHLTSPFHADAVTYELCNQCSSEFRRLTDSRQGTIEVLRWKGIVV